ncbi:MAG: MarR family transcriptional regulator [Lachnospiraceae bacterium]|nr:MarR family transcriptional regulator [Lachnospiraceae bacterium]
MFEKKEIDRRKITRSEQVEYYKSWMRFSFKLVHRFSDFWKDIIVEYDLNQTEFLMLGVVVDHPGLSQQDIVKFVGVDKSIVSRTLKRLEKKDMVTRRPNAEYNHGHFCETTEYGKKVFHEIHAKGDPLIEKRFSLVGGDELKSASEILMRLWEDIY